MTRSAGRLRALETEIDVARAGYSPQIRGGIGTGYDNRLGSSWRPRPELTASQMLYDFGKVGSAVEAANAGTRLGHAQVLLAVDELVRDTGYALVEAQRGAALRTVALEQLASIRDISELVRKRAGSGAATLSDSLQAKARVQAAEATLTQIETAQRRWASNLAFLTGRDAPPEVVPEMPAWLERSCERAAPELAQVPAVMVAQAQREQAAADLRRSRAERLPTVALTGGAAPDVGSPLSYRSAYNFGISVSSTLFSGGANRARMRGDRYALESAEAGVTEARVETGQRLAEAQQQVGMLADMLKTLLLRQTNMAETGMLYRLQYLQMGTRTLVDLLNAEQEFHQVRFEAVNAAHDLRRLQLDCLHFSGHTRAALGLNGTKVRGVTL